MSLKVKERTTRQNKSLKRKASPGSDRSLKKSKQIKEPDFLNSSKYQEKECGGQGNCLFLSISFLLGIAFGAQILCLKNVFIWFQ